MQLSVDRVFSFDLILGNILMLVVLGFGWLNVLDVDGLTYSFPFVCGRGSY